MNDIEQFAMPADFDLRDQKLIRPDEFGKLGLAAPHSSELQLKDFVLDGAPEPPSAVHRSHLELLVAGHMPVWMNLEHGDCFEEMVLHTIEMWAADATVEIPLYERKDAEALYTLMAGWDPADPEKTDTGTYADEGIKRWEEGFELSDGRRHSIVGTIAVDPTDETLMKRAIWDFVVPQVALALPLSAKSQTLEWEVTDPNLQGDAAHNSWGGHAVPYFSYDSHRIRLGTWGGELLATWAFNHAYCFACYATVTHQMMTRTGVSASGINWEALTAAFEEVKAREAAKAEQPDA
jgi:hypothetical protein